MWRTARRGRRPAEPLSPAPGHRPGRAHTGRLLTALPRGPGHRQDEACSRPPQLRTDGVSAAWCSTVGAAWGRGARGPLGGVSRTRSRKPEADFWTMKSILAPACGTTPTRPPGPVGTPGSGREPACEATARPWGRRSRGRGRRARASLGAARSPSQSRSAPDCQPGSAVCPCTWV